MEKDRGFKSKYFNGQKAAHRRLSIKDVVMIRRI